MALLAESRNDPRMQVKCPAHHVAAILFCDKCNEPVCGLCFDNGAKHESHPVIALATGLQKLKNEYISSIDLMKQTVASATEHYSMAKKRESDLLRDSIKLLQELDAVILGAIRSLEQVRLMVYVAVQRAAQTARSKAQNDEQLTKFADSIRKASSQVRNFQTMLGTGLLAVLSENSRSVVHHRKRMDEVKIVNPTQKLALAGSPINKSFNDKLVDLHANSRFLRKRASRLVLKPKEKSIMVLEDNIQPRGHVYDNLTDQWISVAASPNYRSLAAAALWNGKVFVVGGTNLNSVEQYNPETDEWTTINGGLCTVRDKHALVVFDGWLYAIGGSTTQATLSSVEKLDAPGNSWQQVANLNKARHSFAAAAFEKGILVAGGSQSNLVTTAYTDPYGRQMFAMYQSTSWSTTNAINECEIYDCVQQQWQTIASLKIARGYSAAASTSKAIYVFGGHDVNGTALNSIEMYNWETNEWTLLNVQLSQCCTRLFAVTTDESIWIIGGQNTFEEFNYHTKQLRSVTNCRKQQLIGAFSLPLTPKLHSLLSTSAV